ncbi:MAG: hypothetical protein R2867_01020 [Caldilineaceae bacterium]
MTPQQRKAIESLLTQGNAVAAAEAAGIHRTTLYRWMKDQAFVDALADAEAEAVKGLSRNLAGLGALATDALRDALERHQKITVRLRAAEVVTDRLLKIRELVDIEQRLEELEARQ